MTFNGVKTVILRYLIKFAIGSFGANYVKIVMRGNLETLRDKMCEYCSLIGSAAAYAFHSEFQ